jgi:hypothetical protein
MAEAEGWTRTVVVLGGAALVVACMGAPLVMGGGVKVVGTPTSTPAAAAITWPGNRAPLEGFPNEHQLSLSCVTENGAARVRLALEHVTTAPQVDVMVTVGGGPPYRYTGLPTAAGTVELPDAVDIAREIAVADDVYVEVSSWDGGLSYVTADSKSRVERVLEQCWQ